MPDQGGDYQMSTLEEANAEEEQAQAEPNDDHRETIPLLDTNNQAGKVLVSGRLVSLQDVMQELGQLRQKLDTESAALRAQMASSIDMRPQDDDLKTRIKANETKISCLESEVNKVAGDNILPEDTYSFLALSRKGARCPGISFYAALFIFAFQVATLILLAIDVVDRENEENPLDIPAGVDIQVRIAQVIALLITVISQDEVRQSLNVLYNEVRQSLNVLYNGYNKSLLKEKFGSASGCHWSFSILCRLLEGLLALAVTFMLLITVDSVRELLLNFTAVEFVSQVDDAVFLLSKWGYFGETMETDATDVEDAKWPITTSTTDVTMGMDTSTGAGSEPASQRESASQTRSIHQASTIPQAAASQQASAPQQASHAKQKKFPRTLCMFIIFLGLLAPWLVVTIYQERGKYLECSTIYVQFGDEFSPTMGTFSGLYTVSERKRSDRLLGRRVEYVLRNAGIYDGSARFSYCTRARAWTFMYGDEAGDTPNPCDPNKTRAMSSESFSFDLSDTASDTWAVRHKETDRLVPMQHFSMTCRDEFSGQQCDGNTGCGDRFVCESGACVCRAQWYGVSCQFPKPCETLEINERFSGFTEARPWSSRYQIGSGPGNGTFVQVYGRPLYIGDETRKGTDNITQHDVMFFTGRRWILTHTGNFDYLQDANSLNRSQITEFLTKEFHAHWTQHKVAFVSESVDVETPLDGPTPVNLEWFHARAQRSGANNSTLVQSPDPNRPNGARLLCAICDEVNNPCLFDGYCRSDGNCTCLSGSKGKLCQITPDGDGLCNPYFNDAEFGYDGGDCCPNTCNSADERACGMVDINDSVFGLRYRNYVGYPNCTDPDQTCRGPCWKPLLELSGTEDSTQTGGSVALSGNGAVVAIYEPAAGQVRVFEQNGASWLQRGEPLKSEPPRSFDISVVLDEGRVPLVALSDDGSVVAVGSPPTTTGPNNYTGIVSVFLWEPSSKRWIPLVNETAFLDKWSVALSGNGTILAAAGETHVTVYKYNAGKDWARVGSNIEGKKPSIALSDDGTVLVVASVDGSEGVYMYTPVGWLEFGPLTERRFSPTAAISGDGTVLATMDQGATSDYVTDFLHVFKYDPSTWTWRQMGEIVDTDAYWIGASVSLSRDGHTVAIGQPDYEYTRVYQFDRESESWKQYGSDLNVEPGDYSGYSVSLSNDGSVLAFGAPYIGTESPGTARIVWNTKSQADSASPPASPRPAEVDFVNVTIMIQLDSSPQHTGLALQCDGEYIESFSSGTLRLSDENSKGVGIVTLPRRAKCQLSITDVKGNGICCSDSRNGFLEVYHGTDTTNNGNLLVKGGRLFGWLAKYTFVADLPGSLTEITLRVVAFEDQDKVDLHLLCEDTLEVYTPWIPQTRIVTFLVPVGTECHVTVGEQTWVMIYIGSDTRNETNLVADYSSGSNTIKTISFIAQSKCGGCDCAATVTVGSDLECADGFSLLRFEVYATGDGGWLRIYLEDGESADTASDSLGGDFMTCSTYINQTCIREDSCFLFGISRSVKGNGNYTLSFGENVVATSDGLGKDEEVVLFISDACEDEFTLSPTDAPSLPTFPTEAPVVAPIECDENAVQFRLDLTMDAYPQDTLWEVLDRSGGIVFSGGPYKSRDLASTAIVEQSCLPSDPGGHFCVSFIIHDLAGDGICCEHGPGEYTVSLGPESMERPGNFTFDDAVVFGDCPTLTPMGTMSPTPVPTADTTVCETNSTLLRFELHTDRLPEETWWSVRDTAINGPPGYLMIADDYQPFVDAYTTFVREECVPTGICMRFFIRDAEENGICCDNGPGSYKLFLGGSLISEGGEFGAFDKVFFGSCETESPTIAPTFVPLECEAGFTALRVHIHTDQFPEETAWVVTDETNDGISLLNGSTDVKDVDPFTSVVEDTCVPNDVCLSFNISDSFGDGICCDEGNGFYRVYLGNELVASGGEFYHYETVSFGNCETSAPTASPSQLPSTALPEPAS